jgi:adenylosuccinate lyase
MFELVFGHLCPASHEYVPDPETSRPACGGQGRRSPQNLPLLDKAGPLGSFNGHATFESRFRMIPRYSRPDMVAIWEPENRFRIWFEIEAHACDAQAALGIIPKSAAKAVWKRGKFEIARIDEIEKVTHHDVIAFLTNLAEHVGPAARFVHQGMTSSDVLDTCLAVQLVQASDLLLADLDRLLKALETRAREHRKTVCIGRSHGIHAEPTTFGLKLAGHYAAFARARTRLEAARAEIATCAISGAVGTFANIDPRVEAHVARKLGLAVEPISTQVIPRDRHAMFFATLGVIASSVENLAIEIRHLQRTEVREAEEYFAPGQKGSSAMPHKRNPVLTENVTGLARLVRGAVIPALENVALWHERDISHSSVERVIGPDTTIGLDFALARLAGVIEKLLVYPEAMKRNLDLYGGLIHSQRVLLALTQAGMSREDAYKAVQRSAMKVWQGNGDLQALLAADAAVAAKLSPKALAACFDLGYHLKNVDVLFRRVFPGNRLKSKPRRKSVHGK